MTIEIHPSAYVSTLADLEDSSRSSKIVIGPDVMIDSFVKFKAAGGLGNILIGSGTQINSGCIFYIGNGISIGENVSIAANCVLAPTNHNFENAKVLIQNQGFKKSKGGIRIGSDVWIGALTAILDGSDIGNGCVVGASSLVRGVLEENSIYAGNPIRKIGTRY
jgi:virginiamycin A acetyltransferase